MQKRVPERLNLCIRPLLSSFPSEKYAFFAEKAGQSLYFLSRIFEDKSPSPMPKVLRNAINSLAEVRKVAKSSKKTEENPGKRRELEAFPAHGVNHFLETLISCYKSQVFAKFPGIFEQLCGEIDKFNAISQENPHFDAEILEKSASFDGLLANLRSLKLVLCESLLNAEISLQLREIAEKLLTLATFCDILAKTCENRENFQAKQAIFAKIRTKLVKILRNLLFSLSKRVAASRRNGDLPVFEAFFLSLIERLLGFLKQENVLIFELLAGFF